MIKKLYLKNKINSKKFIIKKYNKKNIINKTTNINIISYFKKKKIYYERICINGYINNSIKENQDNILIYSESIRNKKYYIFGVFDGHGEKGYKISKFVKLFLFEKLTTLIELNNIKKESILKVFEQCQNKLKKDSDSNLSGTTVNIILILDDYYISINLGDSVNLIFNENKKFHITKEHNLNDKIELNRIISCGGKIKSSSNVKRIYDYFGNGQGLNITRTLGDIFSHNLGIISEPVIKYIKNIYEDHWLVLCSDGLFFQLNSEKISEIVIESNKKKISIIDIVKLLYLKSRKLWKNKYNYIDDISIILIRIIF